MFFCSKIRKNKEGDFIKIKKKILLAAVLVLVLLVLTGIGGVLYLKSVYEPSKFFGLTSPSESGLVVRTEQQTYHKGDTINLIFENTTDHDLFYGERYTLEYQIRGNWYLVDSPLASLVNCVLEPKSTHASSSFAKIPNSLAIFPGKYRLVTSDTYVEFMVEW